MIANKAAIPETRVWAELQIELWVNCTDMAFAWLELENSVNKWHRLHRHLKHQEELLEKQEIFEVKAPTRKQSSLFRGTKFEGQMALEGRRVKRATEPWSSFLMSSSSMTRRHSTF